jgi:hypothetical protein
MRQDLRSHLDTGRQVLSQNHRIHPQPYPIDSNFDNYWCGSWDEGFPTCDACEHNGESYPNLGELRSVRWTLERLENRGEEAEAGLSAFGPITPVGDLKRVAGAAPLYRLDTKLTNIGALGNRFHLGIPSRPRRHGPDRHPNPSGKSHCAAFLFPGTRCSGPGVQVAHAENVWRDDGHEPRTARLGPASSAAITRPG